MMINNTLRKASSFDNYDNLLKLIKDSVSITLNPTLNGVVKKECNLVESDSEDDEDLCCRTKFKNNLKNRNNSVEEEDIGWDEFEDTLESEDEVKLIDFRQDLFFIDDDDVTVIEDGAITVNKKIPTSSSLIIETVRNEDTEKSLLDIQNNLNSLFEFELKKSTLIVDLHSEFQSEKFNDNKQSFSEFVLKSVSNDPIKKQIFLDAILEVEKFGKFDDENASSDIEELKFIQNNDTAKAADEDYISSERFNGKFDRFIPNKTPVFKFN